MARGRDQMRIGAGRATEAAVEAAALEAVVAARGVELDEMREKAKATA